MIFAQRVDVTAFRRDPLYLLVRVVGVDLTGVTVTYGAGLYPDIAPGFRSLTLTTTSIAGADGIRLVRIDRTPAGQPISVLEIVASKGLMAALPAAPEIGDDLTLAHDLQVSSLPMPDGLTPVEATIFFGTLIIKGSVND